MFGKRNKQEKDELFEKLCLLILEKRNINGVDWEEMVDICETAEEMEYVIKNWKDIKPKGNEKPEGLEDGRIM